MSKKVVFLQALPKPIHICVVCLTQSCLSYDFCHRISVCVYERKSQEWDEIGGGRAQKAFNL